MKFWPSSYSKCIKRKNNVVNAKATIHIKGVQMHAPECGSKLTHFYALEKYTSISKYWLSITENGFSTIHLLILHFLIFSDYMCVYVKGCKRDNVHGFNKISSTGYEENLHTLTLTIQRQMDFKGYFMVIIWNLLTLKSTLLSAPFFI